MSLNGENIYSILFIVTFSIIVHKFLNSFNSNEVVIIKKNKQNDNFDYKITDILEKNNVKCSGKKPKVVKEKFINYRNNDKANEILSKKYELSKKKNNVYFIRPKKQYKDITSEDYFKENFEYPINPIKDKSNISGINYNSYREINDDMDKFSMSNNYYTY